MEFDYNDHRDFRDLNGIKDARDTYIQLGVSAILGGFAFLAFCILRPRWKGLYAARKRQSNEATSLPELNDGTFKWIGVLWNISDSKVLETAGLDAYVFLRFFWMAIKFLGITLFFSLVVMKPVHDLYPEEDTKGHRNDTTNSTSSYNFPTLLNPHPLPNLAHDSSYAGWVEAGFYDLDYLWMYLAFAYLFSGLLMNMMVTETRSLIKVRQSYLGSQTTTTDRTIRLSGVPDLLRSKKKLTEFIKDLDIGTVESVSICQNWSDLDHLLEQRDLVLRELENAMVLYVKKLKKYNLSIDTYLPPRYTGAAPIYETSNSQPTSAETRLAKKYRPQQRVWYGKWKLRYEWIDRIDNLEKKLSIIDADVQDYRRRNEFPSAPVAFVTMDTVASCQMASQAVLDPSPMALIATASPAPGDVVWPNTYLPRSERMFRAWSITFFIFVLTILWSFLMVPIAGVLDLDSIRKIWPALGDLLNENRSVRSLVQTQLPTLVLTLLNLGVTYLYTWLASFQGMISQGDVELSIISKNFFFTFFNFFLVFTALGTAYLSLDNIGNESLRETTNKLALSIQDLRKFYVNYIILQGFAIYPFRLLEFGSVFIYPFVRLQATTPRDFDDILRPPTFRYGMQLPQPILIFIICIVYSCLRSSWEVLTAGLVYFFIGFFVSKYQLLYAMDHRAASNGKSWIMICNRIVAGMVVMQVTIAGQLALRGALRRSLMIIPLAAATLWFGIVFRRAYTPLMTFIALRSIEKTVAIPATGPSDFSSSAELSSSSSSLSVQEQSQLALSSMGSSAAARRLVSGPPKRFESPINRHHSNAGSLAPSSDMATPFINPNMTIPLEEPWIFTDQRQWAASPPTSPANLHEPTLISYPTESA